MPDVVTLGESMIILNPEHPGPLRHADRLRVTMGGSESNTAIGLARLGHSVGWISRLGDDEFGHRIRNIIRGEGVDTSQVKLVAGMPTGLIIKELRADRDPGVFYYRAGSAASTMAPADLNPAYFAGARIVHLSGITPLLSQTCRATVERAMELARQVGATISFDPNVRRKLWFDGAGDLLLSLATRSDLVLAGLDEGETLLGVTGAQAVARGFLQLGARKVVVKLGAQGALAMTADGQSAEMPGHRVERVIDSVGAGDAFGAGILSAELEGLDLEEQLWRGCYAGAAVTQVVGDFEGAPTRAELERARAGRRYIDR